MTLRDLRKLPDEVRNRLDRNNLLDSYGVKSRGVLVEAGFQARTRADQQTVEVREDGDKRELNGYATVYEFSYDVFGGPSRGGWTETIAAGACVKSIRERDDVYLLFDHDGLPLASTKSGALQLSSDDIGLLSVAFPDMTSNWNREIVSRVQLGDLDTMSFAFEVKRQEWDADYYNRRILEVKMFDTSVVKWPANPATHIQSNQSAPAAEPRGYSLDLAMREAEALRLARF